MDIVGSRAVGEDRAAKSGALGTGEVSEEGRRQGIPNAASSSSMPASPSTNTRAGPVVGNFKTCDRNSAAEELEV